MNGSEVGIRIRKDFPLDPARLPAIGSMDDRERRLARLARIERAVDSWPVRLFSALDAVLKRVQALLGSKADTR